MLTRGLGGGLLPTDSGLEGNVPKTQSFLPCSVGSEKQDLPPKSTKTLKSCAAPISDLQTCVNKSSPFPKLVLVPHFSP